MATDVKDLTANANGVFWVSNPPPPGTGKAANLYKLSGAEPQLVGPVDSGVAAIAADNAHVFFASRPGFDSLLYRADGQGLSPQKIASSGAIIDQLVVAGGYVYWLVSTYVATVDACSTPGTVIPQVLRTPVDTATPSTPETVINGCDLVAQSNQEEGLGRFTSDGQHVYARGAKGKLWKVPVAGGVPQLMYTPASPASASAVTIVGSSLVFYDGGVRKIPLGGGLASEVFSPMLIESSAATDGKYLYKADPSQVCRLLIP